MQRRGSVLKASHAEFYRIFQLVGGYDVYFYFMHYVVLTTRFDLRSHAIINYILKTIMEVCVH